MPGLNPFYWLVFGTIAVASIVIALVSGAGAFGSIYLLLRHIKRAYLIAIPISLVVSFVACAVSFWVLTSLASRDPTNPVVQPEESDLLGTWSLTPSSVAFMKTEGGYDISTHSLTLHDDGTFEIVNIPDWWLNFGESRKGFYSGSGTWRIVKDFQGHWTVEVRFNSLPGHDSGLLTYFYIGQSQSGYFIYDYIGDADSGQVMLFEKP